MEIYLFPEIEVLKNSRTIQGDIQMKELKELLQKADWKNEKHVPVLDLKKIEEGVFEVEATVGKEIPHPNMTKHHISYIKVFFLPEGEKFPHLLGQSDFHAHGASAEGPDTSTLYCEPHVKMKFKTQKKGTLLAESYCNIHGLWTSEMELD
jgi:superoxide reductase